MKKHRMKLFKKVFLEFSLSGIAYIGIEAAFRAAVGHKQPHPLVIILGGVAFLIGIGVCRIPIKKSLRWVKPLLGGVLITAWEFTFGVFFNLYLGYDIWNYSGLRFTLLGQVSLEFSLIWVGMMILIEIIDYIFENIILYNSPYSFRELGRSRRND